MTGDVLVNVRLMLAEAKAGAVGGEVSDLKRPYPDPRAYHPNFYPYNWIFRKPY